MREAGTAIGILEKLKQFFDYRKERSELFTRIDALASTNSTLREKNLSLLEENAQLRNRVNQSEDWDDTKRQYQLQKWRGKVSIYSLKPEFVDYPQQAHILCADCFHTKRISFLHEDEHYYQTHLKCNTCGTIGAEANDFEIPPSS